MNTQRPLKKQNVMKKLLWSMVRPLLGVKTSLLRNLNTQNEQKKLRKTTGSGLKERKAVNKEIHSMKVLNV